VENPFSFPPLSPSLACMRRGIKKKKRGKSAAGGQPPFPRRISQTKMEVADLPLLEGAGALPSSASCLACPTSKPTKPQVPTEVVVTSQPLSLPFHPVPSEQIGTQRAHIKL